MNRLWIRLSLAFSAVVIIGIVINMLVPVLLNNAGGDRFFMADRPHWTPRPPEDELVAYYQQYRTWEGAGTVLTSQSSDLSFILADAKGLVVYDTNDEYVGEYLTGEERQNVRKIVVDGQVQGYLRVFFSRGDGFEFDLEAFLRRLRETLLVIALIGGAVSIVFGVVFSRSLASPLNRLAEAARRVGARDFSRRVEVKGSTEITEVARAFNEMAAALEEAERLRRSLVADVAHELRTPLTVFQGNLRAILDDVYPLDKAEIARLYDETRLLSRLVNDLHELSQAEARQLPLNRKPVYLHLLAEDVVTNFSFIATSEDVRVETHIDPGLPPAIVDPDRMAQVLHNLVHNALQHTPAGGTISLHAEHDGDYLRLMVKDTGKGIPAEHLPHVFDRFYRVGSDRSRQTGGAGLGLAIVRAIVEAHDGHVTVESDGIPGHGATFTVYLPVQSA